MHFAGKFSRGTLLQLGVLLDLSSVLSVLENESTLKLQGKMQLRHSHTVKVSVEATC